jgi:hypothetical protein
MLRDTLIGVVAGAVGTVALDIASYADISLRGRSASNAPAKLVSTVAKKIGLPLSSRGVGVQDETVQNRASGLGALLGYMNGLGMGLIYGLLRSQLEEVSIPLASVGVGLAAMAASDIPLVTLKVSNPKTWGVSGWAADIIFHLIYGLATVITFEALRSRDDP